MVKSFVPLHDATMRNHQGLFALLERYLDALDLERVARIVFCGDGAPWIWSGVEALCQRRGLALDVKSIRCLCRVLFEQGRWFRGKISLTGTEQLAGQTLVIGIDGGRLRERRRKRGRKKAGQKRQGYHTDWKEPKLFTLYVLDNEGHLSSTV